MSRTLVGKRVQYYMVVWSKDGKRGRLEGVLMYNDAVQIAEIYQKQYPEYLIYATKSITRYWQGTREEFEYHLQCQMEGIDCINDYPNVEWVRPTDARRCNVWETSKLCQPNQLKPNNYFGINQVSGRKAYEKSNEQLAVSRMFGCSPKHTIEKPHSNRRANPIVHNETSYREWVRIFKEMGMSNNKARFEAKRRIK